MVLALGIASVIGGTTVGMLNDWRARARSEGAARLVLQQVRWARAIAVREGVQVGLVFQTDGIGEVTFRAHRDGNGNGIRRVETTTGIDPAVGEVVRVGAWFPGTRIAVARRLPGIDGGAAIDEGSDAVRLAGGTDVLSAGPTGSTTAGTIYITGTRNEVFAVRTVSMGGRLRLLEFSPSNGTWLDRW
jgi:type II secretory pathway pseudopilin PulG